MTERSEPVGAALLEAVAVMDRLRSPGGCPWDAEQTHASLAPYAIEEAHEVAEAAEAGDAEALAEELGDLLLQVLFHARVASERGSDDPQPGFDIDDVARGLVAKLVRRHPHVFDDAAELTAAQVHQQWDAIKAAEKRERTHPLDGIPVSLPALARAQKSVGRLRKAGVAPSSIVEPLGDLEGDVGTDDAERRIGERLLAVVAEADAAGVDAEAALRSAVRALHERHRTA
ncbi:MAG TPA: MazG family protein [Actinotalea caeni]|uniref:MazG family protein n=1 Tax=Actinotalea caeni TaxID=1348467 RepID=UPI001F03E7D8|nr:MazG family protein [Actinotalea caeni]HLV55212.1 MazG family protein [Actinotalea caeni]